jgi:uncharacterized membrane protein
MSRERLTAFSDGVIAVIITIMVLELRAPGGDGLKALGELVPAFLAYVLSFVYVAIYWNNHHHLFHMVPRVTGGLLWANLHLLFWLSLVPLATAWLDGHPGAAVPVAFYGFVLLMCALAWSVMVTVIIRLQGHKSALVGALGRDVKGKLSLLFYAAGMGLSFLAAGLAEAAYALVALMWLIPDTRIERWIGTHPESQGGS